MATARPTIVGVFENASLADNAIQGLEDAGFGNDQIYYSGRHATGGFMAGLKSLFTGEDTTTGSVTDNLTGMGFSNEEANYYENEYQAGRAVVAVRANGREQEAAQVLQVNGAHTYGRQQGATETAYATNTADRAAYATDTANARTGRAAYATDTADSRLDRTDRTIDDSTTDEARRLRLREEQLNVDKQRVQGGEVRLHKDVISEQKTIDVPVTHEEAYIERRSVTDGMVDDGTPIGEGEAIRVPLSQEQVNVTKNTVATGEVAIGKRKVEETQRVSDTVRHEKARIEQQGNAPISGIDRERLQAEQTNEEDL